MSLLAVGALIMACSKSTTGPTDERAPTGVVEASAPARTFSVSGTVFEHTVTSTRPLAGLHFTVGSRIACRSIRPQLTRDGEA